MKIGNNKVYLLNRGSFSLPLHIKDILLAVSALGFLATMLDVTVAHLRNNFFPVYEWIPILYLPIAFISSLMYIFYPDSKRVEMVYKIAMILGFVTGVLGTIFHLLGNVTLNNPRAIAWFFGTIPTLAPIAIAGMGIFGLGLINPNTKILIRLVALAFLMTSLTSYLDHYATNFKSPYTIFPVLGGIFAFALMWFFSIQLKYNESFDSAINSANVYYAVLVLMMIIGLLGAYFHIKANLESTVQFSWVKMAYGAPVLAPLGFIQFSLLGFLVSLQEVGLKKAI